jgi:FkbM family methyltransferase
VLDLIRKVRDQAFAAVTPFKKKVEVQGVTLSLEGVSARMRYVMCAGYEGEDARLAATLITPEDVVLEVGSAIGFLAIYCMKRLGVRGYCMVEANPNLIPAIRRNFALNGMAPPPIVHAAVCAEDGETAFGINRDFWSSSTLDRPGAATTTVPARSLPSLLAEQEFRPTTLIMDIEGGEASIPHSHFAPFDKVVIEVHPKLVGEGAISDLLSGLRSLGFREVGRTGGSYAFARGAAVSPPIAPPSNGGGEPA